jgi:hypothetical protein
MTRTDASDFWSRRKARVAEAERAEQAAQVELTEADQQARLEAMPDDEVLAQLKLPDPDTLGMGDDFSVFMARQVPERLRRRALRRLWGSNPVLACVDGLNDYDDDYTIAAVTGSAMKTAYKVGRGIVREALEADTPAETAPPTQGAPETAMAAATPDGAHGASPRPEPEGVSNDTPDTAQDSRGTPKRFQRDSGTAEAAAPAPRRRMRFAFDAVPGDRPQDTTA